MKFSPLILFLLLPIAAFSQTPIASPSPIASPIPDNVALEKEFLGYLQKEDYFNAKQHFDIQPDFKNGHYEATIVLTMEQVNKLVSDRDGLNEVGKMLTHVLTMALIKFAQFKGFSMEKAPYCNAMAFMYVKIIGVTGKVTHAPVGESVYNIRGDDVVYTTELKKKSED